MVDGNGHRKNSIARSTHPAVERGTLLLVAKAGDVIPKIIGLSCDVTTAATIDATSSSAGWISLLPPDECPSCGSRTVFEKVKSSSDISSVELYVDSSDNDEPEPEISGRVLRCSGPALCCEARAVGMLALAFSRPALNISGLSKTRIAQLRRAGLLNRASDIFRFVQNSTSLSGGRIRANGKVIGRFFSRFYFCADSVDSVDND